MKLKSKYVFITLGVVMSIVSSLSLFAQSIRLDESQQIWMSTKSISGVLAYIGQDVHVPLYALFLHFWMQIFGSSIIVARIPSFLFFIGTLPILYKLYQEASTKYTAAIATIMFACSPFILWYSSEARMYTLLTLATSINVLYFLRFVRSNGKEGKLGYFLSEVLGLYSHYFFLFVIITQGVFLLWEFFRTLYEDRYRHKILFSQEWNHKQKSILRLFGIMVGGFCLLLPWLLYVKLLGSAANTQPLIPPPTTFNIFETFVNFIFGFQGGSIQSVLISFWPFVVVILFFVFTQKKIFRSQALEYFVLSTFLPIFIAYIISFIRPIFLSRYLIFTLPSLFFLIAWTITNYLHRLERVVVGVFFLLLIVADIYQNYSPSTTVKEDYSDVTSYLSHTTTASDIVTITPPFTIYPVEYTYTGNASIATIPQWDVYSVGPIPAFSLNGLIAQLGGYTKVYTRLFIVTSYDQGYQTKIINYLDTHYHRLAKKSFSAGLQVRVYQLRYGV